MDGTIVGQILNQLALATVRFWESGTERPSQPSASARSASDAVVPGNPFATCQNSIADVP